MINISELFDVGTWEEANDIGSLLTGLRLVGSSSGLTIPDIRKRFASATRASHSAWIQRAILALTIIGLVSLVIWIYLRRRRREQQRLREGLNELPGFRRQFRNLLRSEVDEQLAEDMRFNPRGRENLFSDSQPDPALPGTENGEDPPGAEEELADVSVHLPLSRPVNRTKVVKEVKNRLLAMGEAIQDSVESEN